MPRGPVEVIPHRPFRLQLLPNILTWLILPNALD